MKAKQPEGIGCGREQVKTEQPKILKTNQISKERSDVKNE